MVIFEIKKHFGVLKEVGNGWNLEFNLVSWNEQDPKYDIRNWDENHEKMTRGITLRDDEIKALYRILKDVFKEV